MIFRRLMPRVLHGTMHHTVCLRPVHRQRFLYPISSYPNTSTGRIFGLWFSYLHTPCNGSSAPSSQPRPIHATPSATMNSRLRLRLRRRCRCHRRHRRRRRNLRPPRHRHRHRLTFAVTFTATFSSLYLVDCCLCLSPALLPLLSSSSPPPLSQSTVLPPPPPSPLSSSLPL